MHAHSTTTHLRHRSRAIRAATAMLVTIATLVASLSAATAAEARSSHISWAPEIDRKIVPTRSESHGRQLATWYGPGFFGNRTACGKKLTKRTWGIAHRTLPCGTLVTLHHKGRRVSVRVIDRGPYSGATVDLTSRTKSFLRFASGHVRMTQVKKFRLLPKPVRRPAKRPVKATATKA